MKIDKQLLEDLYWDESAGFDYLPRIKGLPPNRSRNPKIAPKCVPPKAEFQEQVDNLWEYNFTYQAARYEEWWLLDSLGPFFDEQWFDDVLRQIKGGKEASVYLCRANPSADANLLAAKVYRPRSMRNLRKDHIYREGRARLDSDGLEIVDSRMSRYLKRHTAFVREMMHTSWIEHEFRTLKILHKAGCDVPTPYASDHNAILMDYIGDEHMAAPTLNGVHLEKMEAQTLFERVIHNLELMLAHQRVHGDFSAYNILYWDGDISLIDFPQAINPHRNPNAYAIFQRDVIRICEYFITQGVNSDPHKLAEDLWTAHDYNTTPNILWQGPEEDDEKPDIEP